MIFRSIPNNMMETSDSLEAVGVFRTWKNIFFVIVLICLLLVQAAFWAVDLGFIDVPGTIQTVEPAQPGPVDATATTPAPATSDEGLMQSLVGRFRFRPGRPRDRRGQRHSHRGGDPVRPDDLLLSDGFARGPAGRHQSHLPRVHPVADPGGVDHPLAAALRLERGRSRLRGRRTAPLDRHQGRAACRTWSSTTCVSPVCGLSSCCC